MYTVDTLIETGIHMLTSRNIQSGGKNEAWYAAPLLHTHTKKIKFSPLSLKVIAVFL